MKIAVWRYGMALQTGAQSTVGGGFLGSAVLKELRAQGHTVHVVGPVAKGNDVTTDGASHTPTLALRGYDGVVILTGPYNPLYGDAAFDTYRRLASFEGPVVYAQWDGALPFYFGAMTSVKAAARARVAHADVFRNKKWHVLSQTPEEQLRAPKSAAGVPFTWVPCMFELEELKRPELAAVAPAHSAIGYFGSDRPARMREVVRWFGSENSPPIHLYGRWSPKSLKTIDSARGLAFGGFEYRGLVQESTVVSNLNRYTATLYMTDPGYVRDNYITQRFFENVTAGVPVLYSDHLQPEVKRVIPASLICKSPEDLREAFAEIEHLSPAKRAAHVEMHADAVRAYAATRTDTLQNALSTVFR